MLKNLVMISLFNLQTSLIISIFKQKHDIKISNLKKLYSLDHLNKETIDSFKVAINNIKKFHEKAISRKL